MENVSAEGQIQKKVVVALGRSTLFQRLNENALATVAARAVLQRFEPGEAIVRQGESSDSFFVIFAGEATVRIEAAGEKEATNVGRLRPFDSVGEIGVITEEPRSATVVAEDAVIAIRFRREDFGMMFERVPGFGLATCRVLAERLRSRMPIRDYDGDAAAPAKEAIAVLPFPFLERHRVLPLALEGNVLTLGVVDDPAPAMLAAIRETAPSLLVRPVRISREAVEAFLRTQVGDAPIVDVKTTGPATAPGADDDEALEASPELDRILRRMVAEGASDLHLSAGQKPRWRVGGDILVISNLAPLGRSEVMDLIGPAMTEELRRRFDAENDIDFAYAIPGLARFRANLFRDAKGICAVLRVIPAKVLTFEQLGLPPFLKSFGEHPKGLVLVTGPTGSGKSTTLAALIDLVNRSRPAHILTLEDPIEFVHQSQMAIVNQREVGPHTASFGRALKAALREDPDVVLVGEMRDIETVSLALETANTGHLVFGTLHTNTAASTIDRIVDLFPSEQQSKIRSTLGDVLKGVICQMLCKRVGGGRVAALEVLVVSAGIANLIRDGKTHQIVSAMQVGKSFGNRLLNDELARLVREGLVEYQEAWTKAVDKADLARRTGREVPAVETPA